jgi:MarR family transcriptional regulator for hemolysin
MQSLQERFSLALHTTAREWRQAIDRRLKNSGVGQAGWLAIAIVAKNREPLSQCGLAHKLGVEGPTVVAMVDRLVKSGLVERVPSALDRRVKLIVLTAAGHELYAKVKAQGEVFRHELLADIDQEQLRIATELLERLLVTVESQT